MKTHSSPAPTSTVSNNSSNGKGFFNNKPQSGDGFFSAEGFTWGTGEKNACHVQKKNEPVPAKTTINNDALFGVLQFLNELEEALEKILKEPESQNASNIKSMLYFKYNYIVSNGGAEAAVTEFKNKYILAGTVCGKYDQEVCDLIKEKLKNEAYFDHTIPDTKTALDLLEMNDIHGKNKKKYAEFDDPLYYPASTGTDIAEWKAAKKMFCELYVAASERVKKIFEHSYAHIAQFDIEAIETSLNENNTRKITKETFDKNLGALPTKEARDDADPDFKDSSNKTAYGRYYKKDADLFPIVKIDGKDLEQISSNDVIQGQIGDCFFLSAIAAIARVNPAHFHSVIEEITPKGASPRRFKVTFYIKPSPDADLKTAEVSIDDEILLSKSDTFSGTPYAAAITKKNPSLYVPLMEKALAKYFGSVQSIQGGSPNFSLTALTGAAAKTINLADADKNKLLEELTKMKKTRPVVLGSKEVVTGIKVSPSHAYYLVDVAGDNFTLGDPHDPKIQLTLSFTGLQDNFNTVTIGEFKPPETTGDKK